MTTKPNLLNFILSSINECVPTIKLILPLDNLSITSFLFLVDDVYNSTIIPYLDNSFTAPSYCCLANISVGTIKAT